MTIPASFRPAATAKAEKLLRNETDEKRQRRIINEISEQEWQQDRFEWTSWMNQMRSKFNQMHPTPQCRKLYE